MPFHLPSCLFRFLGELCDALVDSLKLGAKGLHQLMRAWENCHRMFQAEAHVRTILFREETRWPGYYFRSDKPSMDKDWECFVNCTYTAKTGEWELKKVPIKHIF